MNRVVICFMKKILLMLLIFFVCGIISADLCIEKLKLSNVILDLETYRAYAYANLKFRDVFWNICYERVKLILVLLLLGYIPVKQRVSIVLICIFSFVWGFFFLGCVLELGLAGVVVGICSVFPHGLIYLFLLIMTLQERKSYSFHRRERVLMGLTSYLSLILMFLTGCVIESVIGTHFIPWVIRLGLI